jgi:hypothetical protein
MGTSEEAVRRSVHEGLKRLREDSTPPPNPALAVRAR